MKPVLKNVWKETLKAILGHFLRKCKIDSCHTSSFLILYIVFHLFYHQKLYIWYLVKLIDKLEKEDGIKTSRKWTFSNIGKDVCLCIWALVHKFSYSIQLHFPSFVTSIVVSICQLHRRVFCLLFGQSKMFKMHKHVSYTLHNKQTVYKLSVGQKWLDEPAVVDNIP